MPQLPKAQTKKIWLPSTMELPEDQRVWIEHKTLLTVADMMDYDSSLGEMANGSVILSKVIINWNVTDENNQPVPINPSTIGLLPTSDLKPLMEIVQALTPDLEEVVGVDAKKGQSGS